MHFLESDVKWETTKILILQLAGFFCGVAAGIILRNRLESFEKNSYHIRWYQ